MSQTNFIATLFGLLGMWSTIQISLRRFLSSDRYITGPPKLPRELEWHIFEICARNNRDSCSQLILVARRVRHWIEPILYEIVILDDHRRWSQLEMSNRRKEKFELFMANIDYKSPEFYSKHVKNLWIMAPADPPAFELILSICSGVENLVLFPTRLSSNDQFLPFLEHPNAGRHLRRLTCKLEYLFPPRSTGPNFHHTCFANLTHLHLYDEKEDWSTYVGFENLHSLTHLAFANCGWVELAIVTPKLPALQYVAFCNYRWMEDVPSVWKEFSEEDPYGIKVVWIDGLTPDDWERGATGRGDFWDLVEQEVARRRAVMAT